MVPGLLFPRALGWWGDGVSYLFIQQILSDSAVVPTLKELPGWWETERQIRCARTVGKIKQGTPRGGSD